MLKYTQTEFLVTWETLFYLALPVSQCKKELEKSSTQAIITRLNFSIRNVKYVSENYGTLSVVV